MNESICDIKNWNLVNDGLYRYECTDTGKLYELSIQYWDAYWNPSSKIVLYIVDANDQKRKLIYGGTMEECIAFAATDYASNKLTVKKEENNMSNVSHPNHYQSKNGLEVWEVVDAFTEDLNGVDAYDSGNILKYMCRWYKKNGIEDLKKARFYLDHLIEHREAELEKCTQLAFDFNKIDITSEYDLKKEYNLYPKVGDNE